MIPLEFFKNLKSILSTNILDYNVDDIQFAIGSTHTLMLIRFTDDSSCVYSWGWNDHGQLGRMSLFPYNHKSDDLTRIEALDFSEGKIYEDVHERSGGFNFSTDRFNIHKLSTSISITNIVCGNDFSLALTREGKVYSWGNNRFGQCGHGKLLKISTPKLLNIDKATSIMASNTFSIIRLVSGSYLISGNALDKFNYTPIDLKFLINEISNQTIKELKCGGRMIIFYTFELDYILYVYGSAKFAKMYNLGNIKEICTNGKFISAIIETPTNDDQFEKLNLYIWGDLRCIVGKEKDSTSSKNYLVGAFRKRFESFGKKKTKRSLLQVSTNPGKTCFLKHPSEVILNKLPEFINCDGQQLVVTLINGQVYGMKMFQIIHNQDTSFDSDNYTIYVKDSYKIKLEPSIYQFTNIRDKRPTIYFATNSLSHSIGYFRIHKKNYT